MPSESITTPKPRIGLLLVHGIGEQRPGDFLSQFLDGFRLSFGHDRVEEIAREDSVDVGRKIHAASVQLKDRTVFLYEVHWADLITKEVARTCFDPAEVFALAWFPWFNRRAQLPGFESYSRNRVLWWTFRLVPFSVLFFLGYLAIRAVPHLLWAWESLEWVIDRVDVGMAPRSNPSRRKFMRRRARKRAFRLTSATAFRELERLAHRGWFDVLLDGYAGDVVNYMFSVARLPKLRNDIRSSQTALRELLKTERDPANIADLERRLLAEKSRLDSLTTVADRILGRFRAAAWVATEQDQCTELQVLGHSLGSVIAFHAMGLPAQVALAPGDNSVRDIGSEVAKLTRFHTIGSPLEKIHFFWPALASFGGTSPVIHAEGPGARRAIIPADSRFEWHNFYSVNDGVSGELRHYNNWGNVRNERVPGLGGLFTAHVSYKTNGSFLAALLAALGAEQPASSGPLLQRMGAWAWSVLQAMVFPLVVSIICLLGIGVIGGFGSLGAAALAALAWGVVSLIRWLGPDWNISWSVLSLLYWLMAIFGLSMVASVVVFMPLWGKRVAHISVIHYWRRVGRASRASAAAA